jgi:multiple sugar transport system substrate-binding protein
MTNWLKEVAKPFAGQTIRLATESTPPSNAINSALKPYFTETTGINVEIEVLPLEQVLQKLTLDVASGSGTYDLYYLDQSWMASFSGDVVDPRERYEASKDLACRATTSMTFCPRWSAASPCTTTSWWACLTTSRSSSRCIAATSMMS